MPGLKATMKRLLRRSVQGSVILSGIRHCEAEVRLPSYKIIRSAEAILNRSKHELAKG